MTTPTLTEFVLARIAEDEAAAQSVVPDAEDESSSAWGEFGEFMGRFGAAHHVTRWNPARVIAECEAKRRIVALCAAIEDKRLDANLWKMHEDEDILSTLAAVYADHPDYCPEWKP